MSDAERLSLLFRGHDRAHGTYGSPQREQKPTGVKWGITATARTIRTPPTLDLFKRHLEGSYPLGIIPITTNNGCYWGGLDIDDYALNPLDLIRKIENASLPLVPVSSKSGGLHLFLFLTEEQPASLVQSVLQNLAAKLGLAGCEIFPKQTKVLAEKGDLGNWLCIPGLGTTFDGKFSEQAGIKKTGARQTLEEFLNHAEQSRITPLQLAALDNHEQPKKRGGGGPPANGPGGAAGGAGGKDDPFWDGPPCLQHLAAQGVPDGGRNSTLFMMGLYFIRKDEATWRNKLDEANRQYFNPPLDSEEVNLVMKSIERKGGTNPEEGYKYTCRTQPMASHCNSKLCRGRRFGIGSEEEVPKLSGISKLNTEPPIWFANVGDVRVELTTEQLQQFYKFHAVYMEKGNVCFPAMKQSDWLAMVGVAMQTEVTILDVSPEVSLSGQFKELLEEFLTDRQVADDKEELLRGLPWRDVDEGRVYFKLSALEGFLTRQNFRHFTRSKISQRLKDLGGDHHFFNLKNRGVNCWWIPLSILNNVIPFPLPKIERGPI